MSESKRKVEYPIDLICTLVGALERCEVFISHDEEIHGRAFGCGNEARGALEVFYEYEDSKETTGEDDEN